uniref:Uncharacterized protein n=1 Tax=Anguilla anguilla TaxID=7936 RepID=A0A0E9Q7B0_ANGAN
MVTLKKQVLMMTVHCVKCNWTELEMV